MRWSSNLAYTIGLLVTDGSLSKDGRHLNFTSKDLDQVQTFCKLLGLENKIGRKSSGSNSTKAYYQVQWGDVRFYKFLQSIGVSANKTKVISSVRVPNKYFSDFLRGHFDGDGYSYSYWDKRWKHSFMLYMCFCSASKLHIDWFREQISRLYGLEGKTNWCGGAYYLKFAKRDSVVLIDKLYYKIGLPHLERKRLKIEASLCIIGDAFAEVGKLVYPLP